MTQCIGHDPMQMHHSGHDSGDAVTRLDTALLLKRPISSELLCNEISLISVSKEVTIVNTKA